MEFQKCPEYDLCNSILIRQGIKLEVHGLRKFLKKLYRLFVILPSEIFVGHMIEFFVIPPLVI